MKTREKEFIVLLLLIFWIGSMAGCDGRTSNNVAVTSVGNNRWSVACENRIELYVAIVTEDGRPPSWNWVGEGKLITIQAYIESTQPTLQIRLVGSLERGEGRASLREYPPGRG
jgi:hypothetical protein